jgi:hypothetical protein
LILKKLLKNTHNGSIINFKDRFLKNLKIFLFKKIGWTQPNNVGWAATGPACPCHMDASPTQ